MNRIRFHRAHWVMLPLGLACLLAVPVRAAEDADDSQIETIAELLKGDDRDMRAMGLQFVREEVPGEAATKAFAALLTELEPEAAAALTEALGDRGDVAARAAILKMLESKQEVVRAAALGALGSLGGKAEVPLLAKSSAEGAAAEKQAARQSLVRLRGEEINAAIVSAMEGADAPVRVELLEVLAARNAKDALPTVLKSTEDAEVSVRQAAARALRFLAEEKDTAALVKILLAAKDEGERGSAELALLAVCTRGHEKCVDPLAAGLADAGPAARIALLHALARAGGAKALQTVEGCLEDEDATVCDEAVRMLSGWPDAAVAARLEQLAKGAESQRHQVLALRGLVRLATPQGDEPGDAEALGKLLELAKRPAEKRLILGTLGGVASPQALALVVPALDDKELAEEAAVAAVAIGAAVAKEDKDSVKAAMEKVLETTTNKITAEDAQKVLDSL